MSDLVEEEVIENNNVFKKDIYCLTLLDTILYEKEISEKKILRA